MKKTAIRMLAVGLLLCHGHAVANGVGYGIVQSDSDPYNWFVILANHWSESTSDVTSIELDSSSSSFATSWVWANAQYLDGEPAPAVTGLNTSLMTLSGLLPTPQDSADYNFWRFRLLPNGLPSVCCVPVDALLGVRVTFAFADSSTWVGVFRNENPPVSDPFTGGIYMLREVAVPEPGTLVLLGLGLAGLTVSRRRFAGAGRATT